MEGTGSAIITDMAVELLPNREIFEDVYPEYDDEDTSDSDADSSSSDSEGVDEEERANAVMGDIRERIRRAEDDEKRASEIIHSARRRLEILNGHANLMTTHSQNKASEIKIDEGLATYRAEREKIFSDTRDGSTQQREIQDKLRRLRKEEGRIFRRYQRETAKADKLKRKESREKRKEKQRAARKQQEAQREQARIRKERESFWPKKVYSIRISLDANAFTPGSSRRNSIASSDVEIVSPKGAEKNSDSDVTSSTCDLFISYVTTDAYWSPAYDMALSTTTNTGHVCFDAQLTNRTSETWSNCKITLSTPQADFSGLNDTIPTLVPWRVRLTGRAHGYSNNDIMFSRDEQSHRAAWADKQTGRGNAQPPRSELFGVVKTKEARVMMCLDADPAMEEEKCEEVDADMGFGLFDGDSESPRRQLGSPLFPQSPGYSPSSPPPPSPPPGRAEENTVTDRGIQSARKSKSIFPRASLSMPRMMSSLGGSNRSGGPPPGGMVPPPPPPPGPSSFSHQDEQQQQTLIPEPPAALSFQESTFEETGFTTTYDLPGLKTLVPASTASKQRVARVAFAQVAFSHTVVAKYKPVAYLQAKLRNGSKLTLLPGPAGLTLDGSFLGRTDMPRCSPGDSFTLGLGVDPAIQVAYPKPDVRRSQSGVFTKEDSAVFTRTITVSNTRSSPSASAAGDGSSSGASQQQQQQPKQPLPARVTVLDQVPVSEDERLRIEVLQPRGLSLAGPGVPAGAPGREGKEEKDWGKAVATLKKDGEVSWDVTLNAGRMVKLGLEYQCAFPTGDHAVNV